MIPVFLDMRFKTKMTVASVKKDLKAFDWIGLTSFVVSFTLILVAISMGGVIYPWGDWKIIIIFAIGFVSAIAFTVYEAFVPKIPFLALALFNNLTIAVTFLGTFIHGYILWSLLLYLPLYYEAVKDLAPTQSGLAVFPESLTVAPTSLIVGILVAKTGKFKWSIVGGWILTTLGTGLLLLLDVNTSTPAWVGINLVVGLGTGMLFSGMAFSIQSAAMEIKQDPAFAIAIFTFFRSLGAVSHELFPQRLSVSNGDITGGRNRDKRRPISKRDDQKTTLTSRTSRSSGTVRK
jgi:hypothetical protein